MPLSRNQIALILKLQAKQFMAGISKAGKATKTFAAKSLASIKTVTRAWRGITVAIGGVFLAFRSLFRVTQRQIEANTRLRAVLQSTAGAAGLTYRELRNMASALQEVTTFGDEAIQEAQALLLTFTSIGREVFPEALESILNVSTALGTSLQSSVQQVGKALNDPIKGIAALTRVGIQFTDQQRQQITTMQRAGDVAGAQAIILGELETQFGGLARAIATTPFGQLEQLGNTLGDIAENIGNELLPGLSDLGVALGDLLEDGGNVESFFLGIGRAFGQLFRTVALLTQSFMGLSIALRTMARVGRALSAGDYENLRSDLEGLQTEYAKTATRTSNLIAQLREGFTRSLGEDREKEGAGGAGRTPGAAGGADGVAEQQAASAQVGAVLNDQYQLAGELYRTDLENYKNLLREKAEADRQAAAERIKVFKESFQFAFGFAQSFISQISEIEKMNSSNRIARLDQEEEAQRSHIKNSVANDEEKAQRIEELESATEKKRRAMQRSAAKRAKDLQIAETLVTIPTAAFKSYSAAQVLPYPANIIVGLASAAATTALGFAKLNAVKSAPLPQLAQGGILPGSAQGSRFIGGENFKPEAVIPLDRIGEFLPNQGGQTTNVYVGNEQLASIVDNTRNQKAGRMGAQNYSFRSVYT